MKGKRETSKTKGEKREKLSRGKRKKERERNNIEEWVDRQTD
jgi:hypothetical protein